jgi:hypothetical protein
MAGRWTDIKLEDGLNEKMAENYVKYMKKTAKTWVTVSAKIYSKIELELLENALKEEFWLKDTQFKDTSKDIEVEEW